MPLRPNSLSLPLAALLVLGAATLVPAQQPATKSAPQRLLVTTAVPEARAVFDTALLEVENAGFLRADPLLRRALELDPNAGVIRAVGAAFAAGLPQAERLAEADRAVVDAARATTPELLTAMYMREWVRRDPAAASALAGALRTLVPDDPFAATMGLGMELMAGKPADVVRMAREFLARNPDVPAIQNLLAYGLYRSGQQTEGLEAMRHYVDLLPNHPNAHDSFGELLQQSGRLDEAEREYRRAVELDPDHFLEPYWGLAEVAQLRRDYRAAQAPLDALVARAPNAEESIDAHRALAFNAVFTGDRKAVGDHLLTAAAVADSAGMPDNAAFSHGYLAILEAPGGDAGLVQQQLALRDAAPAWNRAVGSALAHGAQGRKADVAQDLAALEAVARDTPGVAPDALPLVRLIDYAVRGDVAGARAQLAGIKTPGLRLLGQAFVLRAARRAKDTEAMQAAQAEIAQYTRVDANSAFAHRLVGLP